MKVTTLTTTFITLATAYAENVSNNITADEEAAARFPHQTPFTNN